MQITLYVYFCNSEMLPRRRRQCSRIAATNPMSASGVTGTGSGTGTGSETVAVGVVKEPDTKRSPPKEGVVLGKAFPEKEKVSWPVAPLNIPSPPVISTLR